MRFLEYKLVGRLVQENAVYYILLCCMAVVFFICNHYTPFIQDDYAYCYVYGPDSAIIRPTSTRITSLVQVFISQFNHYNFVNGRITSHVFVQTFCGLLGKNIFNLVNTVVFILFLDSVVRISTCNKRNVYILLLVYAFFLVALPNPGQTFFWLSGSCNYLWSMTFALLMIRHILFIPVESLSRKKGMIFFSGIIGMLIGCMNESITLGVAGGLFFYFFFHRERFQASNKSLFIGYLLGAIVVLVSPGSWARLQSGEMQSEFQFVPFAFSRVVNIIFMFTKLVLPLVALSLFIYKIRQNGLKREVKKLFFLIFVVLSCLLFLLGMNEDRIFFGLSVISTIVILQGMVRFLDYKRIRSLIIVFCLVIVPVYSYKAYSQIYHYYSFNNDVIDLIKKSPKECVIPYEEYSPKRFVYGTVVNYDRYDYHNRVRAFYYDKEYIQALPNFLYEKRKEPFFLRDAKQTKFVCENDTTQCLYVLDNEPYWIFPLSSEMIPENKVYAVYHFVDRGNGPLAFHQRVIRSLLGTLAQPQEQKKDIYYLTTTDGLNYLVLPKEEGVDGIKVCNELSQKTIAFIEN